MTRTQKCWALAAALSSLMPAALLAATDPAARALHEELLTLDTHLDTPLHLARPGWDILQRHSLDQDPAQVDWPRMVEGGLDGGFWVVFTPQGPRTPAGYVAARDYALQVTLRIRAMVARNPDKFELATTAEDARRIVAAGKRVVYISIENGYPLVHDPTLLKTFYDLGVRMLGLVHAAHNDLADSSTDKRGPQGGKEWGGLSPLGRQLIVESNRLGILLDASHASDDVLDQMIALSRAPIILSHSGCKAVYDHPRNVDDQRLRTLAAAGGVIQMNSLSEYLAPLPADPRRGAAIAQLMARYGDLATLSPEQLQELMQARHALGMEYPAPKATFEDYMRHLLHALEVVGPDHVGIGADWDGGGGVTDMPDVASIPAITEHLLRAGYSRQDLEKIWGGNVLRLLRQVESLRQ